MGGERSLRLYQGPPRHSWVLAMAELLHHVTVEAMEAARIPDRPRLIQAGLSHVDRAGIECSPLPSDYLVEAAAWLAA
jgi:hypothetical protein